MSTYAHTRHTSSEAQHWASKRSACDRCRSQKQRCLRDRYGGNSVSCTRCIRADVECVTGSAKPVGRPPRASTTHISRIHSSSTPTPTTSDPAQSQPSFREAEWTDAFMLLEADPLLDFPDTFQHFPINFGFNSISSPSSSTIESTAQPPRGSGEEDQRNESCASPFFAALTAPVASIDGSNPTLHLSSLNLSLSRQLSLVKSAPWNLSLASVTTCSIDINNETHELPTPENSKKANPLGDILQSTSQFLAIVQMYFPPEDQISPHCDLTMEGQQPLDSSLTPPALACSTPGSPFCITTTLALLSCYLQIIAIYNVIFGEIYASLCGCSESSMSGLQMVLDLRLAGFPLQNATLEIKILIQVVVHQSEMIEKALGLPKEYRVSERKEHYAGLLGGREARALVKAVMGLVDDEQQHEIPSGNTGVGLGLGYIVLLRESIERVGKVL